MSQALQTAKLSAEALSFIAGEPTTISTVVNEGDQPTKPKESTDSLPLPNGTPRFPAAVSSSVSMTFRLPADLSARLVRVSVERKLRRDRPFSQQDIVAAALAMWFKKHENAE